MKQKVLRKVIALALMRWHGQLNQEIVREAGELGTYALMSYPEITKALEAMDNTIDWDIVRRSLLLLTFDQLHELLNKSDLTIEDITAAGAVSVIERLFE
jgi:hypothetical protein